MNIKNIKLCLLPLCLLMDHAIAEITITSLMPAIKVLPEIKINSAIDIDIGHRVTASDYSGLYTSLGYETTCTNNPKGSARNNQSGTAEAKHPITESYKKIKGIYDLHRKENGIHTCQLHHYTTVSFDYLGMEINTDPYNYETNMGTFNLKYAHKIPLTSSIEFNVVINVVEEPIISNSPIFDVNSEQADLFVQLPQLHAWLKQFLNNKDDMNIDGQLSLAAFKDEQRQTRYNEIDDLLILALDEEYNFEDFKEFGMTPGHQTHYDINLQKHPLWATAEKLSKMIFTHLSPDNIDALSTLGFSSHNIQRLKLHLIKHPREMAELTVLKPWFKQLVNQYKGDESLSLSTAMTLFNQKYKLMKQARRVWCLEVFELFGEEGQTILLDYLQNRLLEAGIHRASTKPQSLRMFRNSLISGSVVSSNQKMIEQEQWQIEHHTRELGSKPAMK
ncbi:MAG: hypothetical protein ACI8WB_001843 [Phenylobacterium sp.]|jgi:hypothetical protein